MPPAGVKIAPSQEYPVLVVVLITEVLHLDVWDEHDSSKLTTVGWDDGCAFSARSHLSLFGPALT